MPIPFISLASVRLWRPYSHVVFHGPVDQALPFYQGLGFVCPPRKDPPSFLQEIATASGMYGKRTAVKRAAAIRTAAGRQSGTGNGRTKED